MHRNDTICIDGVPINQTIEQTSQSQVSGNRNGSQKKSCCKSRSCRIFFIVIALAVVSVISGWAAVMILSRKPIPIPYPQIPDQIQTAHFSPVNKCELKNYWTNTSYEKSGLLWQGDLTDSDQRWLASFHAKLQSVEDYGINPRLIPTGNNNQLSRDIWFKFSALDHHIASLEIGDYQKKRYSIDPEVVPKPPTGSQFRFENMGLTFYDYQELYFTFRDLTDFQNILLTTEQCTLVLMDKYLQMGFKFRSQRVYGLGERVREFPLEEGAWSMWAKGSKSTYDDGIGSSNGYGVHPFMLAQTSTPGDFVGMFFRSSNAQSTLLTYQLDYGITTLDYISLGGNLEVYFFLHKPAKQIIQMYHNLIGKPNLPPFWALGWSQGSQKYRNTQDLEDMINKYSESDIPLETVYLERSYLSQQANFKVDDEKFPDPQALAESLHSKNLKLVVSVNPALSFSDQEDKFVKKAIQENLLIKSTMNSDLNSGYLVSEVEGQGIAVFLSWFRSQTRQLWYQGLEQLFSQVPYDGLWLDLNEITTLCDGECPEGLTTSTERRLLYLDWRLDHSWYKSYADQDVLSTYYLPFISGYRYGGNYDTEALSLNATNDNWTEYDVHNLNGHLMTMRTYDFMVHQSDSFKNTRPFILTRSSFSGTGKYASHSLSENWRSWDFMRYSISGMMNFNMFGIPHVGADVCGFYGEDRDDEMCARWIQLSTFYPLARARQNLTYYGQESENTEPYFLSEPYKTMARDSIFDRYQYLRHMYTCLFEVSQQGGTCIDPMFYYYPHDYNLYDNVEESFLVGGAIMVSPILVPLNGATLYQVYFPQGKWVNLQDLSIVDSSTQGSYQLIEARSTVQAHLRPGSMIPFQDNSNKDSYSTADILKKPIHLIFNRDSSGLSEGSLFLDQGISTKEIDQNQYEYYKFLLSSKSVQFFFTNGTRNSQPSELGSVKITNAADFSYTNFACYMDQDFQPFEMTVVLHSNVLTLTPSEKVSFGQIRVIYFGQEEKDLNLCDHSTYQYRMVDSLPDLEDSQVSIALTSVGAEGILPDLQLELSMLSQRIINIRCSYAAGTVGERTPFTVPLDVIDPQQGEPGKVSDMLTITSTEPLILEIKGIDGTKVLDISGFLLNSWLNIVKYTAYSDENNFFGVSGLGQRVSKSINYQSGVYSLYNHESTSPFETGESPRNNLYGTDPFYFFTTSPQLWTGVYSNTLQAQDWYVANDIDRSLTDLTSIAIGGIIDLYVITASDPNSLTSDLHNYILGKPALPPVYALGWHQSRWGYKSQDELYDVYASYQANQIPIDGLWSDIDYMDNYRSFTVDEFMFGQEFNSFINYLLEEGLHYIPVIDSGISYRTDPYQNYTCFKEGKNQKLYIMANQEHYGTTYIGEGWANDVAYIDWFHQNASNWWQEQLSEFHYYSPFSGIWLNRNEVASSCNGACTLSQIYETPVLSNLLYVPTARDLNIQSIALEALHANSELEVDTHNLFGVMETQATKKNFDENEQRAFIISRSQTTGMGKYGGNWLGDNFSNYDSLAASLPQIMLMNIFGIPLTGSDICGYIGDTTPDLCLRWTMVGAFFPFARNHNDYFSTSQEPYAFILEQYDINSSYMDKMRDGILNRYRLIKYYYTQFFLNSMYGTGAFFKPLFFEFPDDPATYTDLQYQAMIGPALKLSALTDREGQDETTFYFPAGSWCNIFQPQFGCLNNQEGSYIELSTLPHEVYVHLYEGHIIPMQDAKSTGSYILYNTRNLASYRVDFHVLGSTQNAFGFDWYAQGTFINDDGEVYHLEGNYNHYVIAAYRDLSQSDEIIVKFTHIASASSAAIRGCADINKNDILGDIYLYNAEFLGMDEVDSYMTAVFYSGNEEGESLDEAMYDEETKRVIFKNSLRASEVCLPNVDKIVFTPLN